MQRQTLRQQIEYDAAHVTGTVVDADADWLYVLI